jgi:hypothetical protein
VSNLIESRNLLLQRGIIDKKPDAGVQESRSLSPSGDVAIGVRSSRQRDVRSSVRSVA